MQQIDLAFEVSWQQKADFRRLFEGWKFNGVASIHHRRSYPIAHCAARRSVLPVEDGS